VLVIYNKIDNFLRIIPGGKNLTILQPWSRIAGFGISKKGYFLGGL